MDKVAGLSTEERKERFGATASRMGVHPAVVEKDFWVVWVLDRIFADARLGKILMFKGGTSLSKVFDLIGRFSEDIDLILDWREVTGEDPHTERRSKSEQDRFNKKINKEASDYIEKTLLPAISEIVSPLCSCSINADNPHNINIVYPAAFKDSYLRPEILLEIGPLASWSPSDSFEIEAYAAKAFPDLFERAVCRVHAIAAKRTFWEKLTILHQESNRDAGKPLPPRYSRHYYDLAIMAKSSVKADALADMELLEQVVAFKQKFYPAAWAKFEEAKPGSITLLPPEFRIDELAKDYKAMEHMIFDKPLSFEEILETLRALEEEINALKGD
jgi:hypothetical protein